MYWDFYQPICKNFIIPLWAKWERSSYLNVLQEIVDRERLDLNAREEIQNSLLANIIEHAYTRSPFYREEFDRKGVHPADFNNPKSIKNFPILTKSLVKNNLQRMLVPQIPRYRKYETSGSTGIPLEGWVDHNCADYQRAATIRSQMWSGYSLGDRIFCLYGSPEEELEGVQKFRSLMRRRFLDRTTILDMLRLDKRSIFAFLKKMKELKPILLWGHTHGLFLIAKVAINNSIEVPSPHGIFTAGMPLYDRERLTIENAFGCKVFNRYGCEELSVIASECDRHEGLHMNTDNLFFEFLDSKGNEVPLGTPGQIVLTDLRNRVLPLIRYKLNDVCIPSESTCSCGRSLPLISRIEGRTADYLISTNNQLVSGVSLTDHFSCNVPGVEQIQFIQNEPMYININLVKNGEFGLNSESQIRVLMEQFFGRDMQFKLDFHDTIPQEVNGKYRFSVCNVKHELFG